MIQNKKILFLIVIIPTFIFAYTLGSGELPFNDTLKNSYKTLLTENNEKKYEEIDNKFYETDVEKLININNDKDITEKRKKLINYIWKNDSKFPTEAEILIEKNIDSSEFEKLPNLKRIDKHEVIMEYGVNSISYLFLPEKQNGSLFIYHQGHQGDFSSGYKTIETLLENEYAVLAFSMPLKGKNNQPIVDIENIGVITLEKHNNFHFLDTKNFSSIKFFMHPIALNINYLEEKFFFENYHMIGLSGGAWTITLYSAIDERIEKSFPVGGPMPKFLTINMPGHSYEYERDLPELYRIANYLELFILSSYGEEREQFKILNKYDSCCYYGISYQVFENKIKEKMIQLQDENSFKIYLDDSHRGHMISTKVMGLILENLT